MITNGGLTDDINVVGLFSFGFFQAGEDRIEQGVTWRYCRRLPRRLCLCVQFEDLSRILNLICESLFNGLRHYDAIIVSFSAEFQHTVQHHGFGMPAARFRKAVEDRRLRGP